MVGSFKINIFIDTNIYLSFYHLSSDDLEELKKLVILVREGNVSFLLPEHVIDEFRRNREGKIADALKRMREQRRARELPQVVKHYKEYSKLKEAQAEYEKHFAALIERIEADVAGSTLEVDAVIDKIFQVALRIAIVEKTISNAQFRIALGKPPEKKGHSGMHLIGKHY